MSIAGIWYFVSESATKERNRMRVWERDQGKGDAEANGFYNYLTTFSMSIDPGTNQHSTLPPLYSSSDPCTRHLPRNIFIRHLADLTLDLTLAVLGINTCQLASAIHISRHNLRLLAISSQTNRHIYTGNRRLLLIAMPNGGRGAIVVQGVGAGVAGMVVSLITIWPHQLLIMILVPVGSAGAVVVRWMGAVVAGVVVCSRHFRIGHPGVDYLVITSASSGSAIVKGLVAVVACVFVCLNCVGVGVGARIDPGIRQWIAHCFSSMIFCLSSIALTLAI